jgi:hypothetical protein
MMIGKCKDVRDDPMRGYRGTGGMASLILNLGILK